MPPLYKVKLGNQEFYFEKDAQLEDLLARERIPNVELTDSCAVPDHPMMSRLWSESKPIGTLVIGMTPASDRITRQAASQLHLYQETRNLARLVRNRVRKLLKRQ